MNAAILPRPNESQAQFAMRFHDQMREAIPETDRRTQECFRLWDTQRGQSDPLRTRASRAFPDAEFELQRDVPLFTEHTTKDRAGNLVVYDRNALAAIVDRCNHRISDTGNFSPITEGHTPDRDEIAKGARMPDVLGYAGPYRLGMVGNEDPRWAIFGDEWHHREDAQKLRKMRRRSPEVWLEERMEDRFFDPIAALGAETPRLDMGMAYRRHQIEGRTVTKYSAVFPAAGNVFVQSEDYASDQGESNMAIGPEDIQQIVDALMETEPMQWVQSQMGEGAAPQSVTPEPEMGDPVDAGDAMPDALPPAGDPGGDPQQMGMGAPAPDPSGAPMVQGLEDDPEAGGQPQVMGYSCDDDDMDMMQKYMSGEADDDEMMEYRSNRRYQASVEGTEAGSGASIDDTEHTGYSRRRQQRGQTANQARYARLERDNKVMQRKLAKLEQDKEAAEREAEIIDLARYYAMDVEKEIHRCHPARMAREVYTGHKQVISENYERLPVGIPAVHAPALDRPSRTGEKQSYSAEQVERAKKYVFEQRDAGNHVEYADALAHVAAE